MKTYDYIVVGGGSSGCALTHRLVKAGKSVLLLEAGPKDSSLFIHTPALFYKLFSNPELVWRYQLEPQAGYGGRAPAIMQGRTLGGGSSVNGMVYIRGQAQDYDDWEAAGCTGWGWSDVLPAFKRAEGNQRLGEPLHGRDGPLKVSDPRHRQKLSRAFIEAAVERGYPLNDDFNGPAQDGFGFYQTTTYGGRRMSTARAYLAPIRGNPLLEVVTDAHVTGLTLENGAANGVTFRLKSGETGAASVREEVILTAGVFASAAILQRAGIGPADHLASLGIPVLRDAPEVGRNLQDHLNVNVLAKLAGNFGINRGAIGLGEIRHGMDYVFFRSGLLSSNVLESGGFVDTAGDGRADIQFHVLGTYPTDTGNVQAEGHGMSVSVALLRPRSMGWMKLRSAEPMTPPIIDMNVFSDPYDTATMKRGVKVACDILKAPALARYVEKVISPTDDAAATEAGLDQLLKDVGKTTFHPTGSCRMGGDAGAVVDPTLRVRGVSRLRVADASIMPTIVSGNTNAASIMIGERCADFILSGGR